MVMDDNQPRTLFELISSLSFGGMLGGGFAAMMYSLLISPSFSAAPFVPFLLGGALIGTALQRPLDILWNTLVGPVFKLGTTEIQVRKLNRYKRRGLISQEKYNELAEKIIADDILGSPSSSYPSHQSLGNTTARRSKRFLLPR
jgi:hypothetical protein